MAKKRVDRQADPLREAKYFLAWAGQAQSQKRIGLNAPAFARQQLDRLGIDQDITQVKYSANYILPPSTLPTKEPVIQDA